MNGRRRFGKVASTSKRPHLMKCLENYKDDDPIGFYSFERIQYLYNTRIQKQWVKNPDNKLLIKLVCRSHNDQNVIWDTPLITFKGSTEWRLIKHFSKYLSVLPEVSKIIYPEINHHVTLTIEKYSDKSFNKSLRDNESVQED